MGRDWEIGRRKDSERKRYEKLVQRDSHKKRLTEGECKNSQGKRISCQSIERKSSEEIRERANHEPSKKIHGTEVQTLKPTEKRT